MYLMDLCQLQWRLRLRMHQNFSDFLVCETMHLFYVARTQINCRCVASCFNTHLLLQSRSGTLSRMLLMIWRWKKVVSNSENLYGSHYISLDFAAATFNRDVIKASAMTKQPNPKCSKYLEIRLRKTRHVLKQISDFVDVGKKICSDDQNVTHSYLVLTI